MGLFVFPFFQRSQRNKYFPQVFEDSPAVKPPERVERGAAAVPRVRVTVLTAPASCLVPLVGGVVPQRQEQVEHGVARQQEEDEDEEAQHEQDPGKCQEQMLWRKRCRKGGQLNSQLDRLFLIVWLVART